MKFSTEQSHPNKLTWEGIVTLIDTPSDGVPGGGEGLFVLTMDSVQASYQTLVNMPLNCVWSDDWYSNPAYALTGHDGRFNIGCVTESWIDGNKVMAKGVIWKETYADVCYMLTNAKDALGFSIEADIDAEHRDDGNYYSKEIVFTAVAILWKESAAWSDTQLISLVASMSKNKTKEKEVDTMTPEEMKALLDGFMAQVKTEVSEQIKASTVTPVAPVVDEEAKAKLEKLEASNTELLAKIEELSKAPKVEVSAIPAPSAVPSAQSANPKFGADAMESLAKINASSMSIEEKARARFNLAFQAELK